MEMVGLLAKIFIKEDTKKPAQVRQAYGMLCGIVGILLNVCLFLGKFLAGTLSKSIAITADAFNNLSDAGSSFITLLGFKLAGAKPDQGHPFGHGRMEYMSGLAVAAAILIMAFELIKDSFGKILHPQETEFSVLIVVILIVAILVKLYMGFYNSRIGKKIDSAAMKATALDSLSDTAATTVVLVATLVGHFTNLKIDGYCGVAVGCFIFYAGINAARDTINPLLGQPPEPEFVKKIEDIVMSHSKVCGIHDLIVHDYGPGRQMISLHAEVDAEGDILDTHDEIDLIEMELKHKLGCEATIHMDPIVTKDEHVKELKSQVTAIVKEIEEHMSIHDFRMVQGPSHTNLIFDVVVPYDVKLEDDELLANIQQKIQQKIGKNYYSVVQIDHYYL